MSELEADYLFTVQRRAERLARDGWLGEGYMVLLAGLERARDLTERGLRTPQLVISWEAAVRCYCEKHWMKEPAGLWSVSDEDYVPEHARALLQVAVGEAEAVARHGWVQRGYRRLVRQLELAEVLRHEVWGAAFRDLCAGALRAYTSRHADLPERVTG
jgi:hypothetical protein